MFPSGGSKFSMPPAARKQLKMNLFTAEKLKNERYKMKCERIKRQARELIFENAALCDQIALLQENRQLLTDERNFLLKKLQQYQPIPDPESIRTFSSIHQMHDPSSNRYKTKSIGECR